MKTLSSAFKDRITQVVASSQAQTVVTEENVYQIGHEESLPLIDSIIDTLLLPGSGITGMENLETLLDKARSGQSCLLLLEHYSNLDLPVLSYLLRRSLPRGPDIAAALVAIAGMKLNEASPQVAAFTGAYTRIVICPSRSLAGLDPEANKAAVHRASALNRAAMKTLLDVKVQGKIILVFPAGTRYRPWDPSTRRGVREIDSYLKSFDWLCPVGINGELLHVREGDGDMLEDFVDKDVVRFTAGPVLPCASLRDAARARTGEGGDKKQAAVDAVMALLDELHTGAEPARLAALRAAASSDGNGPR